MNEISSEPVDESAPGAAATACPHCDGTGEHDGIACPMCGGTGAVEPGIAEADDLSAATDG